MATRPNHGSLLRSIIADKRRSDTATPHIVSIGDRSPAGVKLWEQLELFRCYRCCHWFHSSDRLFIFLVVGRERSTSGAQNGSQLCILLHLYPSPGFSPTKTTCPLRITDPRGTDHRGRAGGRENPSFRKDSLSWVFVSVPPKRNISKTRI